MFREYLEQQHGVASAKIAYLPQYAAAQFDVLPMAECEKSTVDLMSRQRGGGPESDHGAGCRRYAAGHPSAALAYSGGMVQNWKT